MTYDEKLAIARMAYKEIKEIIDKWEIPDRPRIDSDDCLINCCWDECIQVENELFHGHQLIQENLKK